MRPGRGGIGATRTDFGIGAGEGIGAIERIATDDETALKFALARQSRERKLRPNPNRGSEEPPRKLAPYVRLFRVGSPCPHTALEPLP